ncbi:MAG: M3 family metallopeptidase, partial [Bdellovibrionales bacterium]|nr:M3 family metallopeptidase [Bdellovibrionales bacterium]
YKKVKYIEQNEKLSENKKIYISKLLTYFDDSGISLQGNERAKFIALNKEQNALTIKFNNNVMAQLNLENFQVHVSDESELEGLPKRVITSAKEKADQLGIEGWVFGSSSENFFAIYDYAKSDALRKRFWIEYNSTNNKGDKFDNQEIVKRLVAIRHEMAKMLGYKNHAERMLVNRMAKTPEKVFQFLNDLADKSRTKATEEVQILQAYRAKITGDNSPFKPWEFRYWSQQYKKDHFNFDKEKLTPYFEITKSLDGIFKVAEKLYGLKFKYRNDLPTYDPTVKVVEVLRANNEKVGLMYVDLFEREGTKRDGAWMMPLISQSRTLQGERIPPVVSINANFAMASDGSSYLNFDNLTTLFHEFGHALHGLMSNVELKTQTGMSVKWDFVELPSQIMENFCYEMEALKLFAYNDDGELIPEEYIEALKKSDKFGGAFSMMSQLHRGALDMGYYTDLGENGIQDLLSLEQEATKNFQLLELTGLEKPYATSFQHIMVGGYQAGYYSYKWAEVLDADAFAAFEETGDIFNPTISSKFETLLSSGASKDEMQLFIDFRGREPSVDYLLRRTGIID